MRRLFAPLLALLLVVGGLAPAPSAAQTTVSGANAVRIVAFYGVMSGRIQEDIDQPQLLSAAADQRLIDSVLTFFRRLKNDPGTAAQIDQVRPLLKGGPGFNHDRAASAFSKLATDVASGLAEPLKEALLGGVSLQQTFYNARTERRRAFDKIFRGYLQSANALDQIAPDAGKRRADLDNLPPDADWDAIAGKADDLIRVVLAAASTTKAPAARSR